MDRLNRHTGGSGRVVVCRSDRPAGHRSEFLTFHRLSAIMTRVSLERATPPAAPGQLIETGPQLAAHWVDLGRQGVCQPAAGALGP